MRAIVAHRYGGPDVLELADVPRPEPGPRDALVRVVAAGTNPIDAHARSAAASNWFGPGSHVWGWDISGVVAATGPDVREFVPGDSVFGMARFPVVADGYAEYVSAPANELAAVLAAEGRLIPEISRTLLLEEAAEAHRQLDTGHGRGKLVLVVDPAGGHR